MSVYDPQYEMLYGDICTFEVKENKLLLSKVNKLKKIHQTDLKTKMLLSSITTALEAKINIARE